MSHRTLRFMCSLLLLLTFFFFTGMAYVFLNTYYLCSYKTVKIFNDPRWRVFDFNSRQASEGEIYTVADIPALKNVRLVDKRRLRFEFTTPFKVRSWKTIVKSNNSIVAEGHHPEIQFSEHESMETYIFKPEGIKIDKEITIQLGFWPSEKYEPAGLSWPDNYWIETMSVPVSLKHTHTVDEWAGLPGDDPEIIEARRILGKTVNMNAPALERIEKVYRFVMENTNFSHEIPSDEVQAASPLETYKLMNSGMGKGWCENHAVVYYLFANAAGIKTRLVDLAGKLGPLKLTGHYFCESWIPEYATWAYVDPETYTAFVTNADGVPLTTLMIKRLIDLNVFEGHTAHVFDFDNGIFIDKRGKELREHFTEYWLSNILQGDVVLGYKFGYGSNRSFSKVKNFFCQTTLLYAPFALPKLYLIKYLFLCGFLIFFTFSTAAFFLSVVYKRASK